MTSLVDQQPPVADIGMDDQAHRFFTTTIYLSVLANVAVNVALLFKPLAVDLVIFLIVLMIVDLGGLAVSKWISRKLGYHIYLAGTLVIFIAIQMFSPHNYFATTVLYPILILFSIFFFNSKWITLFYTALCFISALITVLIQAERLSLDSPSLAVEIIVTVIAFLIFFTVSDLFVNGMRKRAEKIQMNEAKLQEQKARIQDQNGELLAKNDSLEEAEKVLSAKNEELERYIESNMQLENFAYIASHDLQAPLTGILALSDMLFEETKNKLDYAERKSLDLIRASASNMKVLVQSLLEYSKADSEKLKLSVVDPNDILSSLLADISISLRERNAVVLKEGPFPKHVTADPVKLKQLFQNLISNGIKFSKPGSAPVVKVSCVDEEGNWRFRFSDNGIGIPADKVDDIFVMFKRLHSEKEYKGSGIGLALCKKLVEQHGGQIWVESKVGEGSSFNFALPQSLS